MQNKTDNQVNAGFFVRLAAYLIDSIIVGIALLVVELPFTISSWVSPNNIVVRDFIFEYSISDIVLYVLRVLYFIILTYRTGATLGKKLFHIRVVSAEGRELTLWEVIYRETIGRFLSALIMNIGYLMVLAHGKKRGLHDLMADTKVIYYHRQEVIVDTPIEYKEITQTYTPVSYSVPTNYSTPAENCGSPDNYEAPTYGTQSAIDTEESVQCEMTTESEAIVECVASTEDENISVE